MNVFTIPICIHTVVIAITFASLCAAIRATVRLHTATRVLQRLRDHHTSVDSNSAVRQTLRRFYVRTYTTRSLDAHVLELLLATARACRLNASLFDGLRAATDALPVGAVRSQTEVMLREARQIGLASALRLWGERSVHIAPAAWALAIIAETGADPTPPIDAIVSTMRSGQALNRELGALTAQSTLSAGVLACVPVLFAGLLSGTDPHARAFLLFSPIGRVCLVVGLVMDLIAWKWLKRIGRVAW